MSIVQALRAQPPGDPALRTGTVELNRSALLARIEALAEWLLKEDVRTVALHADNGVDWVVADLACMEAGIRIVPVPLFFSPAQVRHTLETSGADVFLGDRAPGDEFAGAAPVPLHSDRIPPGLKGFRLRPPGAASVPDETWKITYTSGTTGAPTGVCLSLSHVVKVAETLAAVTDLDEPQHLCVLPLSTLLENIAGVYAPLLAGGAVTLPSLSEAGLSGSSSLDITKFLACIGRFQPHSLILVPEMLRVLTIAAEGRWLPPGSLRFVAVGGGKVAPSLIARARGAGLPVYEGYGLSECASVVSLNTVAGDAAGSAGRVLPHLKLSVIDGEIRIRGHLMLGYVNQPVSWYPKEIRTGDLGSIDDEGFVHIEGRKKNVIITSYGRNVSPEWIESELLSGPLLMQAIVAGDGRPWCSALVCPADEDASNGVIDTWIRKVNKRLPDYARIASWRRISRPLSASDGLLTDNGRLKRAAAERYWDSLIQDMYQHPREVASQ